MHAKKSICTNGNPKKEKKQKTFTFVGILTSTENDLASFEFDYFDAEVLEPDIHETDSMISS